MYFLTEAPDRQMDTLPLGVGWQQDRLTVRHLIEFSIQVDNPAAGGARTCGIMNAAGNQSRTTSLIQGVQWLIVEDCARETGVFS